MKLKTVPGKFLFKDFDEYAELMQIPKDHPSYDAFREVWDMARTPDLVVEPEDS